MGIFYTFTHLYIYIHEFKPLEIKPQGSWLKRTLSSAHFKRTLIAIGVGSVLGFAFFYFTEGRLMESIPGTDILKSLAVGGFFGFFMTNSPCARGRC